MILSLSSGFFGHSVSRFRDERISSPVLIKLCKIGELRSELINGKIEVEKYGLN